jgi:hypothetical protein
MTLLIIVIVAVLLVQVGIFVMTRKKIKKERAESVVEKYSIKSSGDAWRVINDMNVPEEDRNKIEAIYSGNEKEY